MDLSPNALAAVNNLIQAAVGADSQIYKLVQKNQEELVTLQARVKTLEQKVRDLEKRHPQEQKAGKEIILTGFSSRAADIRKPILTKMKKIDKDLRDHHIKKCVKFGASDKFQRVSIIVMSNHVRETFIHHAFEQGEHCFSRGQTQAQRAANKEKYNLHNQIRQRNHDEPDKDYFHHMSRNPDGQLTIARSKKTDQARKNEYAQFVRDLERQASASQAGAS